MPAELEPGKQIKRLVSIYGIGQCEVTVTHEGLSIRVPGSRQFVTSTWDRVVDKAGQTPSNVPCFLAHDGTKLLQYELAKIQKRKEKKDIK